MKGKKKDRNGNKKAFNTKERKRGKDKGRHYKGEARFKETGQREKVEGVAFLSCLTEWATDCEC